MAVLCYGAGENMVPFVTELHRIMTLFRFEWEIVLVANYDPGAADPTPSVANRLARELDGVRSIAFPKEGAMGWDMKCGLDACAGRYIGVIDGDGQFPVETIFSCFAKIKNEDLDFVKTYRAVRDDGSWRRLVSTVYNRLFVMLFPKYRGYHDVNSKPKIFKREAYERMTLRSTDWFLDAEIVLQALELGLRIDEIPIKFYRLAGRQPFVRIGAILRFTKHLLAYRFGRGRQA